MMDSVDPFAGFGLGLRKAHYSDFLPGDIKLDFLEVISENYMIEGGRPLRILEEIRANYPVILHGVSLSVGSAGGLDVRYLAALKNLADRIQPLWMSDHLCWTRTSAHNSHDLLPLPLTSEALTVVCDNLSRAQDYLGRALLLENPSSYLTFPEDEMTEWEFLAEVARRSGCYLLLDVNNVVVSAHNHGFSPQDYLEGLPLERVRQVHLAGHTPGPIAIDTHDRAVPEDVWTLYAQAMQRLGPVATMIERDGDIPPLTDLMDELEIARRLAQYATDLAA